MKKQPTENNQTEDDDEFSPEFIKELRRRIADTNVPVRYVIYSNMTGNGAWKLWLDVSKDVHGMSIDQATLFKRKSLSPRRLPRRIHREESTAFVSQR